MNEQRQSPPFSEEAEKGILGAIIYDAPNVLDECISGGVTVEDFFLPKHREIITAIGNMCSSEKLIDVLTITEWLKRTGKLEAAGGETYLMDLVDTAPASSTMYTYIDMLHAASKRRHIVNICKDSLSKVYSVEDPEELRAECESSFASVDRKRSKKTLGAVFDDILFDIEQAKNGVPTKIGTPTGIAELDELCDGGMRIGVYWLSGVEGTGKTSLKCNIIDNFLKRGEAVADLTLEMSVRDEIERITSVHLGCNVARIIRGKSHVTEAAMADAKKTIVDNKLLHVSDQTEVSTTVEFKSWAKRMVAKHNIKLICVDYFQRLEVPNESELNLEAATTRKSAALTSVANILQVPILCLAAINEQGKVRGSRMADYDGAGHWRLEPQDTGGSEAEPPFFERAIDLVTQKARFGVPFKRIPFIMRGATGEFLPRQYGGNSYDEEEV